MSSSFVLIQQDCVPRTASSSSLEEMNFCWFNNSFVCSARWEKKHGMPVSTTVPVGRFDQLISRTSQTVDLACVLQRRTKTANMNYFKSFSCKFVFPTCSVATIFTHFWFLVQYFFDGPKNEWFRNIPVRLIEWYVLWLGLPGRIPLFVMPISVFTRYRCDYSWMIRTLRLD